MPTIAAARRWLSIDLNWLVKSNSGWDLQWALDINGRGQIVGYGTQNGVFAPS